MEREVKKLKATDSDAPLDLADPDAAANHASIRKLETYLEIAKGEINRLDYIISQFCRPSVRRVRSSSPFRLTIFCSIPHCSGRKSKTVRSRCRSTSLRSCPTRRWTKRRRNALVSHKNAIQAIPRGALTLTTIAETDGVWVYADTGGGIPQEKINRIFSPISPPRKKAVSA